jgi:hypothetical protein
MGLLPRGFLCSACCAFALGLPFHLLAQEQKSTSADPQQAATIAEKGASASLALAELPDSPGAEWAKSQPASSQQAGATGQGSSQPNAQATQPQASGSQDQKLQHRRAARRCSSCSRQAEKSADNRSESWRNYRCRCGVRRGHRFDRSHTQQTARSSLENLCFLPGTATASHACN